MPVKMNAQDANDFLARVFGQVAEEFTVEEVTEMGARLRLNVGEKHLRPGGTVSGPAMFSLVDVAVYIAILGMIGPKALSVTTNCTIDFMRKPEAGKDLIGVTVLHKLGRQLAVGDVLVYSEGMDQPVARATATYAIPPAGSAADVDA